MIIDSNEAEKYREAGKEYYFLQPRASMLGKSESDIYKYFTTRQEMEDDSLAILSANSGTALHRLVLAQQYQQGNLETAEKFVHNKKYNFTGHIDAVSKSMGLGDVKTVSRSVYHRIKRNGPMASHVTQVNAYMATTGQKEGYIQYIMREDPTQQVVFKLDYDAKLFDSDMDKIQRVQNRVMQELKEGKLNYKQLRQGTHAQVLEEEGKKAHQHLIDDIPKMENLIDYFFHYQKKEDRARGNDHKLSFTNRYSNKALNPAGRREDQNTITGMMHGWFGRQRTENTDFGSPYKIGSFNNIKDFTDDDVAATFGLFDERTSNKALGSRNLVLDSETFGFKADSKSLFQFSFGLDGNFNSIFLKQESNDLGKYHETEGSLGEIKRKLNLDFTKEGSLDNYASAVFTPEELQSIKVKAKITTTDKLRAIMDSVFNRAKKEKRNIITANGLFDAEHIQFVTGNKKAIRHSPDMRRAIKESGDIFKQNRMLAEAGQISHEELFDIAAGLERRKAAIALTEALEGGHHVDILQLGRAINATMQQKGIIPKTGKFGTGASVEFFAKHILNTNALHDATRDSYVTGLIGPKMAQALRDLEQGKEMPTWLKSYAADWNENLQDIFSRQIGKKIDNELEVKGTLSNILPEKQFRYNFSPINEKEIFDTHVKSKGIKSNISNAPIDSIAGKTGHKMLRFGAATVGALLIYAATKNAFQFSGRDDEQNTIEGLKHGGWAEKSRKLHSDFGSGYQMQNHHYSPSEDPSDTNYAGVALVGGAALGAKHYWNKPVGKMKVDDLGYLGKMSSDKLNSEVLGRTHATYGDIALATIRRAEDAAGGFFRSFGISEVIGSESYKDMTYTVDITTKESQSYAEYINALVNKNLQEEGVSAVTFSKGKMYLHKRNVTELVPGDFRLIRMAHDLNQNESMSQLAKAMTRIKGVNYVDPRVMPFLPYGGEGINNPALQKAHGYFRETLTKYLNLMRNPLDALSQVFPDAPVSRDIGKLVSKIPIGIGTEEDLLGPTGKVLGRHALKLGGAIGLAYFGYGLANDLVRGIAPDGTVAGEAGLTGIGAETIRTAHQTYARASDITGLTGLRDKIESAAPGMEGWKAVAGLTFSGALAGATLGIGENLISEASNPEHYKQFLLTREATEEMPEFLKRIPGLDKKFTKVGKYARLGGLAGLALSLPFAIAGLGADKSYEELEKEYTGETEVAVKKGRFWEASMTPWEGGKTEYYRPNWYRRIMDDPRTAELYSGEKISTFGKLIKDLVDPYWLEKERYYDQPYPIAGPDGSAFGVFGPLYEATLGRVIKAPARMHQDELNKKVDGDITAPDSGTSLVRKQWASFLESAGLRGFGLGAIKEAITGSKDIESYSPELASSSAMNSIASRFHELQLGGGFLTTEAARRVLQKEDVGSIERINPLKNNMPSWMPGMGFHTNFQEGDPFTKVKEGYYRLPGEGFATRYKELQGLNPEDYPDIYKYKILADVAHGSQEFREVKGRLDNRTLTPDEMTIFNQVEEQLQERNESNENFRDPAMYDTLLGKYSAILTDVARNNPVEHLTPFSPAHKFLPGPDPIERYEESILSKDFKSWSNPFDDFVKPAANMALHNVGINNIPEEVEYARQLEDYFDKLEYLKHQREARIADAHGDTGAANLHRGYADKTLSGLDPYMDQKALLSLIPKRERPYFEKFIDASEQEKARILEMTSPAMRDIYLAQWDKQAMVALESGEVEVDRRQRAEVLSEIKTRAAQIRTRRKSQIQEFASSDLMPSDDWEGWNSNVDLDDVKMKYLVNEGRDYHYYGLWKDRMNQISRKPYVAAAAENMNFRTQSYRSRYSEAYDKAREIGIVDPKIAIHPGLESGYNLEVQVHRENEQREVLRDLGYII